MHISYFYLILTINLFEFYFKNFNLFGFYFNMMVILTSKELSKPMIKYDDINITRVWLLNSLQKVAVISVVCCQ